MRHRLPAFADVRLHVADQPSPMYRVILTGRPQWPFEQLELKVLQLVEPRCGLRFSRWRPPTGVASPVGNGVWAIGNGVGAVGDWYGTRRGQARVGWFPIAIWGCQLSRFTDWSPSIDVAKVSFALLVEIRPGLNL